MLPRKTIAILSIDLLQIFIDGSCVPRVVFYGVANCFPLFRLTKKRYA